MRKSGYSKINLYIRSLIFFVFSAIAIMFYSTVVILMWLFPLSARHAVIRFFLRTYMWSLKMICHIDYQVTGEENIPQDRVGIALCKHQSAWETFFVPLVFHDPAVIAKRELLFVPFFGWGLAAADPIIINRAEKSSAMQQVITKGKACLDAGRWVVVFPEGTRVPYGKVGHYKLGGARLAAATSYPVVPVAHDAGLHWPKRGFVKYPGTIHVMIGPVIESVNRTPEEISDLAKTWIEDSIAALGRHVDKTAG